MRNFQRIRANCKDAPPVSKGHSTRTVRSAAARLSLILLLLSGFGAASLEAQSTYQITSATYGTTSSSFVPAGVNGAALTLTGTLPTAAQQSQTPLLACFYTGYGSTAGFALSPPTNAGTEPLTVPASTIQSIPQENFTAANNYSITALVYFVTSGSICDGEADPALTNRYPIQIVAPSLGAYSGPVNVPQTNPSTSVQAAPLSLTIPAGGFFPTSSTAGSTTVLFGNISVPLTIPATATSLINVPVPATFSFSPVGTTASLHICNELVGSANAVCTTPTPAITLTVTALAASAGTIAATPNPVITSGQTVLTAQFKKGANAGAAPNLGAPSGPVSFVADGTTLPPAPLVLDTTATFTQQTTSVTTAKATTPEITPAAGSYIGVQTIVISDSQAGAAIYYTQDGSTPTTASTPYTSPFRISTSQTVSAIGAIAGSLNSAVATAAYVVTIRPATQLAFRVQPVNSALNAPITPAVQVALEDSTGAVVAGSSAPVTLAIGTNPANGVLSGTVTVNAVNGIATFSDLSINGLGTGYTLRATSGTLPAVVSSAFNITPPPITMTVQSTLVGINSTLNGSFTLGVAAPTGGLTVNLSSGTPANVTIAPATVTVAAGQTTGTFTYTGVASGNSTLKASATGYQDGTVLTTGTAAQVSLGTIPNVAPAQMQSLALSLPTAAPPGGTTVTFTIANTNIATVTQSIFVPAGMFTAATNPQVTGVLIGTTTVTASAPGYAPAIRPVVVTVTASFNPATTNINLITSTNTALQISAPAPAGGITFSLTSSDPTKATVPASVTVIQGGTNVKVPITGVADGTVTITASSTGITNATGTVNVNSTITSSGFTTGYDLQYYQYYNLPVTPSTPTNVTFKVSDPTVAIISTTQSAVGQQTIVLPNVTTSGLGYLYIQGKKVGTTTLTISAPGYTTGTETITVTKSGFAYYYGNQNFTTTTYAAPNTLTIYPFLLDANQSITGYPSYAINPGTPALSVPVTSSDTTIGTVTSPIVFNPLDTGKGFTFTPVAAGTANLTIGAQPAGFTQPMQNSAPQYQTAVATVNTPVIIAPSGTTGVHLQASIGITLPVAPPTGVTVTVTIAPAAAGTPLASTLSKSQTVAGTTTQTFTNVTTSSVGALYMQGQSAGTATITVSAPGYVTGTNTITVQPSGFAYYYGNDNFSTTSFSGPNTLTVYPFLLDGNKAITGYPSYTISPGVGPVTVPLTNSNDAVGTISTTSLTFNTNDPYQQFTFQPVSAGTDNITIGAVTGFITPTTYTQATETVTAPAISVNNQTTGVHLQNSIGIYLPVAPPSARTVTVSVPTAGVVTLSKDNVTAGTTTLTFANVTTSFVGTIYIQGQGVGTATITESAPGYVTGTGTLNVLNSGFGFYPTNGTFTTTTFSPANTLTVYTLLFDANNNYAGNSLALSPGVAPVTVAVADSNTSVGTISSNSLVFSATDTYKQFTFKPVSAGTANLALSTPAGFTVPTATSAAGVATVTAPGISVSDSLTGINLETTLSINLPQTPPNPVTVTVKSNGPLIAVLSNGATVTGTGTLTFNNVTTTNVGTIYVQGLTEGSTTLKVSAPGYTDGDANIKVDPSGFSFYYNNSSSFTTSVGSSPTQLPVYPVALVHGTLTPDSYNTFYVSPSAGTVNVPITSSAPAVGTVANPLVFAPGASYGYLTFTPVATGTSTLTIGTPAGFSVPTNYTTSTATVQ